MACEEKNELLLAYQTAVRLYALAVDQLQESRSTASRLTYSELKGLSDQARQQSEFSRLQLERHVSVHGCGDHNQDDSPLPITEAR